MCVWSDSGEALECQCQNSKTRELSSGWSFLQRGLYFIRWHFWGGRKIWSGRRCHDSFLAAVFLCPFNFAESPSTSTVRPHSGCWWPNNLLLLSECPLFCFSWKVPFRTTEPLFGLFRIKPWRNLNRNHSKLRPRGSCAYRGKANPI